MDTKRYIVIKSSWTENLRVVYNINYWQEVFEFYLFTFSIKAEGYFWFQTDFTSEIYIKFETDVIYNFLFYNTKRKL